ncbi:hypothetical protein CYMTET_24457 [Cymbomonas tetramitiformis]|uniref:Uncharacterized protein n=1 Tax=Cymbomonas tetramitiformis TaxID=36881 RepID=A0AAE0FWP1_9CHLO|nr:hypothetical protein CYMTET_24457 [Cymbomonas tetramitiformis]
MNLSSLHKYLELSEGNGASPAQLKDRLQRYWVTIQQTDVTARPEEVRHALDALVRTRSPLLLSSEETELLVSVVEKTRASSADGKVVWIDIQQGCFSLLACWLVNSSERGVALPTLVEAQRVVHEIVDEVSLAPAGCDPSKGRLLAAALYLTGVLTAEPGLPAEQRSAGLDVFLRAVSRSDVAHARLRGTPSFPQLLMGTGAVLFSGKIAAPQRLIATILHLRAAPSAEPLQSGPSPSGQPATTPPDTARPQIKEDELLHDGLLLGRLLEWYGAVLELWRAEAALPDDVAHTQAAVASMCCAAINPPIRHPPPEERHLAAFSCGGFMQGLTMVDLRHGDGPQPPRPPHMAPILTKLQEALDTVSAEGAKCLPRDPGGPPDGASIAPVVASLAGMGPASRGAVTQPARAANDLARCLLHTLCEKCLSLRPMFSAAAACSPPEAVSELLQARVSGDIPFRVMSPLLQAATALLHRVEKVQQERLFSYMVSFSRSTHEGYRAYVNATSPEWMEAIDSASLRLVLDATFFSAVIFFNECLLASPQRAGEVAGALAWLEFCRVPSKLHTALHDLLRQELEQSEEPAAALLEQMPPYEDLMASCGGDEAELAWLADSMLASRMHALMVFLLSAIPALKPDALLDTVVPVGMLYLGHHRQPLVRAAHDVIRRLFGVLPPPDAARMVPYYCQQALQGYPSVTPLESYTATVATLMCDLPANSASKLYCVRKTMERAVELSNTTDADMLSASTNLFHLVVSLISIEDWEQLPELLQVIEAEVLRRGESGHAQKDLETIYKVIHECNDYARKMECVAWYQRLRERIWLPITAKL